MDYSDVGFALRSAIMQVVLFSIVPFVLWKLKFKRENGFFRWIGLYKPSKIVDNKKIVLSIVIYFIIWIFTYLVSGDSISNFEHMGFTAIVPSFIACFIQNGVSEEILFRGFIGKRLISKFGKDKGIFIQGILFGMLHIGLSIIIGDRIDFLSLINLFIFPTIAGWMLGYIDEKIYNGSIIPGILLHGIVNFTRDMILAFS